MDVKDFLRQIRKIDILINAKQEEIERLRSKITYPGISYEERTSSSFTNGKEANIIKLVEYEEELNKKIDEYIDKKKEVAHIIDQLKNADYIDILYKRYFQFKTWEEIASEKGYTFQWVHKLHARALKEVEKLLKS